MSSSDSEFEPDLEEQARSLTTCSICFEQFTDPKVLPCQHTFCLYCIKRCYESANDQRMVRVTNFPCPTCRKTCHVPYTGINMLPTDFRIGQILDLLHAIEASKHLNQKRSSNSMNQLSFGQCCICRFQKKERPAEHFCLQCEKAFCSDCLNHHSKTKIFKDHVVINDSEKENKYDEDQKCKDHGMEFKYYCEECCSTLCTVCILSEHAGHSIKEKEQMKELLISKFNKMSEDLQQELIKNNSYISSLTQLKTQHFTNFNSSQNAITNATQDAINKIKQLEKDLLNSLKKTNDENINILKSHEDPLLHSISQQQALIHDINQAKKFNNTTQFFTDFKKIEKAFINENKPADLQPFSLKKFEFLTSVTISLGSLHSFDLINDLKLSQQKGAPSSSHHLGLPSTSSSSHRLCLPSTSSSSKKLDFFGGESSSDYARPKTSGKKFFKLSSQSLSEKHGVKAREAPSEQMIKGLSRRLSGRLTQSSLQIYRSPNKKKISWLSEGFTQCRDCCFLKMGSEWCVAACDLRASSACDRIKIFNIDGTLRKAIGVRQISKPWGILFQESMNSFIITDQSKRSIVKIELDENGQASRVLTLYQSQVDLPTGISITRSGDYVVTNTSSKANRLLLFQHTSNIIDKTKEFGQEGSSEGEIELANYVIVDHNDRIVVSDIKARSVKSFAHDTGHQLLKFSCTCSFEEMAPQGVAVDDNNHIFICDQSVNGVVMFTDEGSPISTVASTKGRPWGLAYLDELRMLAVATDKGLEAFEL